MSEETKDETIKNESETRSDLQEWVTQFSRSAPSTFEKITGFLETVEKYSQYTDEQMVRILKGTENASKIRLSNYFYETNDLYKVILNYMASYFLYYHKLNYMPLSKFDEKEFVNGMRAMDNLNIKSNSFQVMLSALREGSFYGVVNTDSDEGFALIKLPVDWCIPAGVDRQGLKNFKIDLRAIEQQARSQRGSDLLNQIKKSFPKEIYSAWKKYQRDTKDENRYALVSSDIGLAFSIMETQAPPFLSVIEDIQAYSKTKTIEYLTALDELRKIIVQKFPLGKDDELIISTPEMKEYHRLVGAMLQNNPYIDLISTVAEIDKIQMQDANKVQDSKIKNTKESVYDSVGLPHMLFSPSGNTSLKHAISKDGALLTHGIEYLSKWFSNQINIVHDVWYKKRKKDNFFEVSILSISHYNREEYIKNALEMARSGYDIFTPAIASGQTQLQVYYSIVVNEKLNLVDKMKPLKTSYTMSENEGGAPELKENEKDDKTIENNNGEMEV